jgi:hypothetical protein
MIAVEKMLPGGRMAARIVAAIAATTGDRVSATW